MDRWELCCRCKAMSPHRGRTGVGSIFQGRGLRCSCPACDTKPTSVLWPLLESVLIRPHLLRRRGLVYHGPRFFIVGVSRCSQKSRTRRLIRDGLRIYMMKWILIRVLTGIFLLVDVGDPRVAGLHALPDAVRDALRLGTLVS